MLKSLKAKIADWYAWKAAHPKAAFFIDLGTAVTLGLLVFAFSSKASAHGKMYLPKRQNAKACLGSDGFKYTSHRECVKAGASVVKDLRSAIVIYNY